MFTNIGGAKKERGKAPTPKEVDRGGGEQGKYEEGGGGDEGNYRYIGAHRLWQGTGGGHEVRRAASKKNCLPKKRKNELRGREEDWRRLNYKGRGGKDYSTI